MLAYGRVPWDRWMTRLVACPTCGAAANELCITSGAGFTFRVEANCPERRDLARATVEVE